MLSGQFTNLAGPVSLMPIVIEQRVRSFFPNNRVSGLP